MNKSTVRIYPDRQGEVPMRNILGINNTPAIKASAMRFEKPLFDSLRFRYIRHHDATLVNAGQQLLDVHRIFPLFHLDENDPRNYIFDQSDDYLRTIADGTAELCFRLGESIDNSHNARLIQPPKDVEKWARICRNIIGHYKNGEMNGMYLNITSIDVWEEPNNDILFGGTVDEYAEMFFAVYRILKRDFPDLKIGGPTTMACNDGFEERFLTLCKQEGIAPDYFTHTAYSRDVDWLSRRLRSVRNKLDSFGFTDMPQRLAEWHTAPTDWERLWAVRENGFATAENAAFSVCALIDMLGVKDLDAAYYYIWSGNMWALLGVEPESGVTMLWPIYYGLAFFQKLAVDCKKSLFAEANDAHGIRVLAGETDDGGIRVLLSCYDHDDCDISVCVPQSAVCHISSITGNRMDGVTLDVPISVAEGCVTVTHTGKNGVYLLEFSK